MTDWQPRTEDLQHSNVALFMRQLGFDDYDAFYQFSIEHPDRYWRAFNDFNGTVWSRDYDAYVDESRGAPFARWFAGGELNWVDMVMRWADHPATRNQAAIVAERESGSIETVTYSELRQRVQGLAAGLAGLGIRRGDRIGLLMENGLQANITFLALSFSGVVVVPLFSGFGVDAIVSRLGSCEARAIIATTGFSRRGQFLSARTPIELARAQLPTVEFIVWKPSPEGPALSPGELNWYDAAATPPGTLQAQRMRPDDPFMVIYTSGTTGKPKGPVHTHGGFPLKIAHDSAIHFDMKQGDVFCWPADMGWIAGSLVSCSALLLGATLITYDGAPDFPDWSRMASLIARHRVTHYGASPTLIRGYASHPERALAADLSTIRLLVTAGESIDPEHFIWFQTHFGRGTCPVINYTGGTEVSGAILASVVVKPIPPSGFNSASPGLDADVIDLAGSSIREQIGELAIRRPFVGMTQSFWEDDARYLETYWATVPGIWVHGDLAIQDKNGVYFILGRSDDTIKVAGKRLGPAEIEEILLELEIISEVAAIGVDDPVKGQKLLVFVVTSDVWQGQAAELETLVKKQVEERMGKPFRPNAVFKVSLLPKTRSQKVMRRVIRNIYAGRPLGDMSALDNPPALDELCSVIAGSGAA